MVSPVFRYFPPFPFLLFTAFLVAFFAAFAEGLQMILLQVLQ
jgi:hypothetical protein